MTPYENVNEVSDKISALESIISDQGLYFNPENFNLTCKNHGINHTCNLVKYPRGKEFIEILNRLFLLFLRGLCSLGR